ncbi:DEAD-box ATP-dependent RNA helicase 52B [Cryptomeria japonica]|uniref:DEAD-box ATP-dependent RNA helicase 52B n=1 Tax=Cryptomeria japonica TaxID=3369 RepID=UPI0027DA9447|nr:DEAD-box ATP-dependent RNA helicase 52B [Cryptomeria japonica]XP_057826005.2 DEAD-box ATP-dependent RNA helicase 52B [Cryptomeria japonica]XP_057826006.2 DEAD-box ATP-dependent RNA helicase 52B [Cryptomeria japonica]
MVSARADSGPVLAAEKTTENATPNSRPARPSYVPPHLRNKDLQSQVPVPSQNSSNPNPSSRSPNPDPIPNPNPIQPSAWGSNPRAGSLSRTGSWAAESEKSFGWSGERNLNPNPHPNPRGRGNTNRLRTPPTPETNPFASHGLKPDVVNTLFDQENTGINFEAYEDIPVETSGENVPPPVGTFAEIDLGEALNLNIKRCNYVKPTPVQRYAIPISLAGRDLMACAQTGSGKTAAFCFPIISAIMRSNVPPRPRAGRSSFPLALILSPTRELSMQIYEEARKFAYQSGIKVVVVYGGAPINQQLRELERGVDILVATPGRLSDLLERGRVSLSMVKHLALDEADRMLDMGFEPQIRKIVETMDMPPVGKRQTLLFSATFPREIQRLASDFLSNYIFLAVGRVGSSTDLIVQRVEFVLGEEKRSHLMDLLHGQRASGAHGKHALTLVFVETKKGADSLEYWLCSNGFPATTIHGDRSQQEREQALRSFKSGTTPILVATDVAARGLDIPHVAHVVNFDLPNDIDDYVHRIGRTGRAGNSGLATAFFNESNMSLARPLAELMQESNQDVPTWLHKYAASSRSSFGSGGRGRRSGGNRFGSRDYRRDGGRGSVDRYGGAARYGGAHGNVVNTYGSPAGYGYSNPGYASAWD